MKNIFTEKHVGALSFFALILFITVINYYVLSGQISLNKNLTLAWLIIFSLILGFELFRSSFEVFGKKKYINKYTEDLDKVTVIIPCHNGDDTIAETLENTLNRFKKTNVILVSDNSNDDTVKIAKSYGVKVIETVDNLSRKVGAINQAMALVETPYTLIIDDDVLINDSVIPTSLLDEGIEAVAFNVLPKIENELTRLQYWEYTKVMSAVRMFQNDTCTVPCISGAIGLFNTAELKRQIDIHSGEFSGEDFQRTLLILEKEENNKVVIVDSVIETFAPLNLKVLFSQRVYGWGAGFINCLHVIARLLFKKSTPLKLRMILLHDFVYTFALDIVRFISVVLIPYYVYDQPKIFFSVVALYILVEGLFLFKMNLLDKHNFYIPFIMPFYGLFNFITRIIAYFVFVYRRLCVFYSKEINTLDAYMLVNNGVKFYAYISTVLLLLLLLMLTAYIIA